MMQLPDNYRAWTWQGGADALDLRLETVERQALAAGDVLVRNAVIGLNPVDWKVLGNAAMGWRPGKVPGVDGAGTIVAVGDGVPASRLGRRVAYHQSLQRPGSFAEFTPIAARALLRVPDGLDFTVAAGFPCPGLTAWQAIEKLPARPGEPVLISGAGGGVGNYLVQFAAARGFAVTAMCNPRHWGRLRTLGASGFLAGPLGTDELLPADRIDRYFAVIDSVGPEHAACLAPALLAGGHLVCIQGRVEHWPGTPFGRTPSLHEVALGATHQFGHDAAWQRLTGAGEQLLTDLSAGRLKPEAALVRSFAALPELLKALRHRQFGGKALVSL